MAAPNATTAVTQRASPRHSNLPRRSVHGSSHSATTSPTATSLVESNRRRRVPTPTSVLAWIVFVVSFAVSLRDWTALQSNLVSTATATTDAVRGVAVDDALNTTKLDATNSDTTSTVLHEPPSPSNEPETTLDTNVDTIVGSSTVENEPLPPNEPDSALDTNHETNVKASSVDHDPPPPPGETPAAAEPDTVPTLDSVPSDGIESDATSESNASPAETDVEPVLISAWDRVEPIPAESNPETAPLILEPMEPMEATDATEAHGSSDSESVAATTRAPHHVISMEGFDPLYQMVNAYYGSGYPFCDEIHAARQAHGNLSGAFDTNDAAEDDSPMMVTLNITFNCAYFYEWCGYGTANVIALYYGLRLTTRVYTNVALSMTCDDAEATKSHLILPWLTGYFPPRAPESSHFLNVTPEETCVSYQRTRIAELHDEIQSDFRHLAVGLVGMRDHPASARWAREQLDANAGVDSFRPQRQVSVPYDTPVYAPGTIELDDAVIHFRCGDLMDAEHAHFAFLTFDSYVQHLSPEAASIGIITQPFSTADGALGQSRWVDRYESIQDKCRAVVTALVDVIQTRHPTSRVTVHNGPSETTALAYARLIMANQTIAGISTFGVFPALATFGTGYIHRPDGPFPNAWLLEPTRIDTLVDNVEIYTNGEYMMVADMKQLWATQGADAALAWFRGKLGNASVAVDNTR